MVDLDTVEKELTEAGWKTSRSPGTRMVFAERIYGPDQKVVFHVADGWAHAMNFGGQGKYAETILLDDVFDQAYRIIRRHIDQARPR